jgi:hypothetical protein
VIYYKHLITSFNVLIRLNASDNDSGDNLYRPLLLDHPLPSSLFSICSKSILSGGRDNLDYIVGVCGDQTG